MITQRTDKWLWTVRVFKTRSLATEACRKGRVELNGQLAKASSNLKPGDTLIVLRDQLRIELRVIDIPANRVGAKLLPAYLEDLTPPELVEEYREKRSRSFERRARGEGRPTKKERRDIDRLKGED